MKNITYLLLGFVFLNATFSMAQAPAADKPAGQSEQPATVTKQPGMLADSEIEKFVKEYTDEKTGKSYQLSLSFSAKAPLTDSQKKALKRPNAKLPYQIFGYLFEVKKAGEQVKLNRVDKGTFEFYIQDENGKYALNKKSLPFVKLCKS